MNPASATALRPARGHARGAPDECDSDSHTRAAPAGCASNLAPRVAPQQRRTKNPSRRSPASGHAARQTRDPAGAGTGGPRRHRAVRPEDDISCSSPSCPSHANDAAWRAARRRINAQPGDGGRKSARRTRPSTPQHAPCRTRCADAPSAQSAPRPPSSANWCVGVRRRADHRDGRNPRACPIARYRQRHMRGRPRPRMNLRRGDALGGSGASTRGSACA